MRLTQNAWMWLLIVTPGRQTSYLTGKWNAANILIKYNLQSRLIHYAAQNSNNSKKKKKKKTAREMPLI